MGQVACCEEESSHRRPKRRPNDITSFSSSSYHDDPKFMQPPPSTTVATHKSTQNHPKYSSSKPLRMDYRSIESDQQLHLADSQPHQQQQQQQQQHQYNYHQLSTQEYDPSQHQQQFDRQQFKQYKSTSSLQIGVDKSQQQQQQQSYNPSYSKQNLDLSNSQLSSNPNNNNYPSLSIDNSTISQITIPPPVVRSTYSIQLEPLLIQSVPSFSQHYYLQIHESKCGSTNWNRSNLSNRILTELQQISLIKYTLVDERNGSLFITYAATKPQFLQFLVIGPADSPFAFGTFLFDVFIPDDYPTSPPRVHFVAPTPKKHRYSPKLLPDGRLKLDILGISTRRQQRCRGCCEHLANEKSWNATMSILHVIRAIQTEIFSETIDAIDDDYDDILTTSGYCDSCSHALNLNISNLRTNSNHNESSINLNRMYSRGYMNVVQYATVNYAIIEVIKSIVDEVDCGLVINGTSSNSYNNSSSNTTNSNYGKGKGGIFGSFVEVLQLHFSILSSKTKETIQQWIESAKHQSEKDDAPLYTGIVSQHNKEIAELLESKSLQEMLVHSLKSVEQVTTNLKQQ